MKFATFFDGNSFQFDHGPPDDDFLEALRGIGELARTGKRAEALDACVSAADREWTDLQKSHVLELATRYADGQKNPQLAEQLIARIPIPSARKMATMQHLLDTGKAPQVVVQFAEEDLNKWPFWKRGDGLHARGRAWFITKAGDKAEVDLTSALTWISEPRTRDAALLALAQNREGNLKNDAGALEAYQAIANGRKHLGGADEFSALQGIARILTRLRRFDEALQTLNRVELDKLPAVWRRQFEKSIEDVQQARKQ